MRKLLSLVRGCVDCYDMIPQYGRIAVGVSGGKDSITLLTALAALSKFHPQEFSVFAITLDMGFPGTHFSSLEKLCNELDVPFKIIETNIAEVVFDIRKESNPCSLCAKLRRGALHEAALAVGCRTVALGHHFDDAVETCLLSLFYEGRFNCFSPKSFLDRKEITIIRPLLYVPELYIQSFVDRHKLPVVPSNCPADKHTKRQEIKELLAMLEKQIPGVRQKIFGAMQRFPLPGWEKQS